MTNLKSDFVSEEEVPKKIRGRGKKVAANKKEPLSLDGIGAKAHHWPLSSLGNLPMIISTFLEATHRKDPPSLDNLGAKENGPNDAPSGLAKSCGSSLIRLYPILTMISTTECIMKPFQLSLMYRWDSSK